jgi:hypothetical protein
MIIGGPLIRARAIAHPFYLTAQKIRVTVFLLKTVFIHLNSGKRENKNHLIIDFVLFMS